MSTYLKNMAGYKHNQLKNKSFDDIQKLFDKAMKRINTFVDMDTKLVKGSEVRAEAEIAQESSSKRAGTELEQESIKKQKVDEDKETAELQRLIEVVPDKEELAIDAIPLATKPPSISYDQKLLQGRFGNHVEIGQLLGHCVLEASCIFERVCLRALLPNVTHAKVYSMPPSTSLPPSKLCGDVDWVEIIRILTEQVTNFAAMADYSTFLIVYKSRPLTMLLKLLFSFLLKIKIYGPGLVILSAYATLMPPVLLLPLPKAKELSDFVDARQADVLCLRANALKRWAHALERRAINLDRLTDALDQCADALERRLDVYMVFFLATKDENSGILMSFITGIENLVDHKVKVIRCDNGTEFKNKEMNQFYEMKGILRQYSVAKTLQQNRVAERRNRTLIEAARTMLADSKLPTTFWAEAVNYCLPITSTLSFITPFGYPVTILNTIDHLGKFDGKADECMDHIAILIFEALTQNKNYESIVAGTQSNDFACTKASDNAGQAKKETKPVKNYILLPLWPADLPYSQDPKCSHDDGFNPLSDDGKKVDEDPRKDRGMY
ncbi:ribonuclease H-like domain-containing protein [Tanacetum coccineum]